MTELEFTNKIQEEFGLNPEFSSEEFEYITKIQLMVGDLIWYGIGYNLADANSVVINKAVKFLGWKN